MTYPIDVRRGWAAGCVNGEVATNGAAATTGTVGTLSISANIRIGGKFTGGDKTPEYWQCGVMWNADNSSDKSTIETAVNDVLSVY